MKTMNKKDFAEAVIRSGNAGRAFKPMATYIPEGDCIEAVITPDDYHARRLDGLVTVYYSRRTGQIAGAMIKGVLAFCRKMAEKHPGFKIELEGGAVKLEYIFLLRLWSEPRTLADVAVVRTYRDLIQAVEEESLEADLQLA